MADRPGATRLSSVLFQNEDQSVVLLDVPRSIEEGQVLSSDLKAATKCPARFLVSSKPISEPFQTPEPNHDDRIHVESVSELMVGASVDRALECLQISYSGPWCLPRVVKPDAIRSDEQRKRKRKLSDDGGDGKEGDEEDMDQGFAAEPRDLKTEVTAGSIDKSVKVYMPPESSYLHGTIASQRDHFLQTAPIFDLIILDPPWPNRSARRKRNNYNVASTLPSLRNTLSLIPIPTHLAANGLVAIWITNKPSIIELLTSPRDGLLPEWGLELVGEWTWLKVTATGAPIVHVRSRWRKPWERLLIARRRGSAKTMGKTARDKVIVSVPDVHSRKPCLRGLFEDVFPDGCRGLEVFARNLTAGWWSWGDEVLKFQAAEHWVKA